MKNLLYILAVVAIGTGAFFGWQLKDKTEAQLEVLRDVKGTTSAISKTIAVKESELADVEVVANESRTAKDEAVAALEAAEGKKGDLQRSLDQESNRLEVQNTRIAELDTLMLNIRSEVGDDVDLDSIPAIVEGLESDKKLKDKKLAELESIRNSLTRAVAESESDIERAVTKIAESKARVRGNTFRATVTSVNTEWGFLVVGAGEKSGLKGDSKLLLVRNGRYLGNVLISSLEANQAIAEIAPGSIKPGVRPRPGDSVILADTASN